VRILELFSGIGGLAAAVQDHHEVVAAIDHDLRAQQVYAANFAHRREVRNLASVKASWLAAFGAELWWMSPPCAPHGIRGKQEDLADPRSAAFQNLLRCLPVVRPRVVALENVPGFAGSAAHRAFLQATEEAGLVHRAEREICPTELGIPGIRRRFYAVASADPVEMGEPPHRTVRLRELVDEADPREALRVPEMLLERFGGAFHRVDPRQDDAVAACFTRAYTRSPVYAGSYLVLGERVRWFSPEEIARLHGHPEGFSFAGLPEATAWKLVGNGLSVPVVRWVLSWLAPPP
jgi:site-specific DNA-cytosine methylase